MMQSYQNHSRIYKPHHITFFLISLVLMGISIYRFIYSLTAGAGNAWLWGVIIGVVILLTWFSGMTRNHYAMTLQNRLITDEVKFRYYRMTGNTFREDQLDLEDKQLYALRFAGDDEFINLIQQADEENLSSKEIKQSVENWNPDYQRV